MSQSGVSPRDCYIAATFQVLVTMLVFAPEDSDRVAAELQLQKRVRQAELALAKEGGRALAVSPMFSCHVLSSLNVLPACTLGIGCNLSHNPWGMSIQLPTLLPFTQLPAT